MQTSPFLRTLLLLLLVIGSNAKHLLDYDGKPVRAGVEYYMTSITRGAGGGGVLPVPYPGNSSCPSYVGWAWSDLDAGVPVIINSANRPESKSIMVGERVYIRFSKVDGCVKTPYWTLEHVDGDNFVTTGATVPVREGNMFVFRKGVSDIYNAYGLTYCPCNNVCRVGCVDVGRSGADGQRILGTNFEVDFNVFLGKAKPSVSTEPLRSSLLTAEYSVDD